MGSENNPLIVEVRELLREGEYSLALDRLRTASHGLSSRLFDEALLLESRFNRLSRDKRKGLVTREEYETELNRWTLSLSDFVAEVSRTIPATPPPPEISESSLMPESVREIAHQKIIGVNNLKQISWVEIGVRVARSVCRILTPQGRGTGFLVGGDLLMTNHHVIPSIAVAEKTSVEFDYQQDSSGGFLLATRYDLDPTGFHTSAALDYSLIRVRPEAGKPPLETWGKLRLNPNADPLPEEHVTIIQHPNGGYKQIVMTANWVIEAKPPILHYTTDTMPGSSGSPVFNDQWHVIAIHHSGGKLLKDAHGSVRYVNEGVLMSAIRKNARAHWPQ